MNNAAPMDLMLEIREWLVNNVCEPVNKNRNTIWYWRGINDAWEIRYNTKHIVGIKLDVDNKEEIKLQMLLTFDNSKIRFIDNYISY